MNLPTDATRDELLDTALDSLKCQSGETRKIARWGLEQIVESVIADCNGASKLSRQDVTERLVKLARAAKTTSQCLADRDVGRVLELHIPAIKVSLLLPNTLPRHLRALAKRASNAAADPDLRGGGNAALGDVFDLPAKTKLAALVDPVFEHFRGKRGTTTANSDLDIVLKFLWEAISGKKTEKSFERHIRQARAKGGRNTTRRFAALATAQLEAQDILDGIREKQQG